MPLKIALLGITGKMGKCLLTTALKDPQISIVAGVASPRSNLVGQDLGILLGSPLPVSIYALASEALDLCDVAIDFSVNAATYSHVKAALEAKTPLVIGTTGQTEEEKLCIQKASQEIPIAFSPNFSLGISLCIQTALHLAQTLSLPYTIEIHETHHIHKKDKPSGTALAIAEAFKREKKLFQEEILIHSNRLDQAIGEHSIVFECGHERIEIKHTVHSREPFAHGALLAAKAIVHRKAGLFSFKELLHDDKF